MSGAAAGNPMPICDRFRIMLAALRRHVQMRDRHCVGVGCRRRAATTDLDHTRDHAHGGQTVTTNSGPHCPRHHTMKHQGGWTLQQPQAGHFIWTSRLGHTYHRPPPAIIEPLPDPIPRDGPPYSLMIPTDDGWEDTETWANPPPEPDPEPDPPPKPDPRGDVPPF